MSLKKSPLAFALFVAPRSPISEPRALMVARSRVDAISRRFHRTKL